MVSRYHWLTGGVSVSGAVPLTTQTVNAVIPAGGIIKRFQLRNCNIAGYNTGLDDTYRRIGAWSEQVSFTAGPMINRVIYSSTRMIPQQASNFVNTGVPVHEYYVNAGDNEMAFNQRCSYGLASGPTQTLTFVGRYIIEAGSSSGTLQGNFQFTFAVLYYL